MSKYQDNYQGYWEDEIKEFVSLHGNSIKGYFEHENGQKVCDAEFYIDSQNKLRFVADKDEYTSPSAALSDMGGGKDSIVARRKVLGNTTWHIYRKLIFSINDQKASMEEILNDMGIDLTKNLKGKPTGTGRWYNFEELPARKSVFDLYGNKIGTVLVSKGYKKDEIVRDLDALRLSEFKVKYKLG